MNRDPADGRMFIYRENLIHKKDMVLTSSVLGD